MKHGNLAAPMLVMSLLMASAASWAQEAGTVKSAQGDVRVERAATSTALHAGDVIHEKDRIVVPAGGSAGITLKDETLISIGPKSILTVDRFAFDSKSHDGQVVASILRGAARFVSGLVARSNPKAIAYFTPTSTIGIRGTDVIMEVGNAD